MKKMFKTEVFDRNGGYSSMSERSFMATIAGFVVWGLLMIFIMATKFAPPSPSLGYLLGVGLALPIIGILVAGFYQGNPILSFIGFNLIAIPIGLCMGWVSATKTTVIQDALTLTLLITCVMGVLGIILPKFFESIGGFLFYSLLALVIVRTIQMFVPAMHGMSIIDYVAAGIFSLYIGYDMHRATLVDRNVANALQVAISLVLDIVNLFVSLISALSDD
jgi:FtsH-binding integral membrane protein